MGFFGFMGSTPNSAPSFYTNNNLTGFAPIFSDMGLSVGQEQICGAIREAMPKVEENIRNLVSKITEPSGN